MKNYRKTNSRPFPPGSRILAYLRDSGGNDQDLSVEQQEAEVVKWCDENGFILEHVYKDVAKTASTVVGRDDFDRMMHYIRSKNCLATGVLLWRYNRFARDFDDAQFYKADIRRRGYIVYSLQDKIPDGANGRFFEAAIDWSNAKFLEDLSVDVRRGLHHNVEKYGGLGGRPPKGFKREIITIGTRRDGTPHNIAKWIPDPELWETCRLAWKMRADGASYPEINKATGLFGSLNSYPTFFKNRLYIGELVFGEQVIKNYCEPLVDQETWDRVQAINTKNAKISRMSGDDNSDHPRRQSGSFLLSRLTYCAYCGSLLVGNVVAIKGEKTYRYYLCGSADRRKSCAAKKIPAEVLEDAVLTTIQEYVLDPENLAACKKIVEENMKAEGDDLSVQRGNYKRRLASVRRKISNITDAIAEAETSSRSLLSKLNELESEETEIKRELAQLDILADQKSVASISMEQIREAGEKLRSILPHLDPDAKRRAFQALIHRVTVERDGRVVRGMIEYYYPPDDSGLYTPPSNDDSDGDNDGSKPSKNTPKNFMPMHRIPLGAPGYCQNTGFHTKSRLLSGSLFSLFELCLLCN